MADIFPTEAYPSDAAIAQLDATTDQRTGLPYIAKGTGPASVPSYEIQYNRRLQRQNQRLAVMTEGLVVDEGGLKVGVYPCNYTLGGQHKRFAGATAQTVPDNDTRFVYIDSDNTLQIAASYPVDVSTFLPLATVVALNGALTIQPDVGYARTSASALDAQIGVTVAAEAADLIAVTFELQDPAGNPLAQRWVGEVWLSDSDFGDLAAVAPNGGVSVTTGEQLGADLVTDKHIKAISDGNGAITIDVVDSATPTFFVMVAGFGISVPVSASITFS
jgi:hypothetical protein